MANKITNTQHYQDIADAIRAKNGSADTYTPAQMAQAIEDLPVSTSDPLSEALSGTLSGVVTIDMGNKTSGSFAGRFNMGAGNVNAGITAIKFICPEGSKYSGSPLYPSAYPSGVALEEVDFGNMEETGWWLGSMERTTWQNLVTLKAPKLKATTASGFMRGAYMQSIKLPRMVSLASSAFMNCQNMVVADLGSSDNTPGSYSYQINTQVFNGCSVLDALIIRNPSMMTLGSTDALRNTPIAAGTGYIYVPRSLISTYEAATNWSTYAGQFRAIEDYTVDGTIDGEFIHP